jgi:hypothetical protein
MGLGKDYLLFWLMQTLLPQAPATASTRSTGLPFLFFFYLHFSSSFFFSFFLPFFLFYFSFFLFSSSFFFLFFYFLFLLSHFLPSLLYLFLVALLEGARKGIINNYYHFIDN